MSYMVVWLPSAINELADIWNRARDRQAVSEAANRIDRLLRIDPERKGQPFHQRRVLADTPLVVTFAVHPDDCRVDVLQVRRITP
jgi:plasmid stabilization system protein ParE